jgi:type I restriction enzyme S subunit
VKTAAVPFSEALKDVSAGNTKIPQSEFLPDGPLAVVDQGQSLVAGFTDDRRAAVRSPAPLIVFGDHTRAVKFIDFPFAMGADGVKVLQVRDGFDPKFVYHYLRSRQIPSAGYSRHFKFLKEVEVPKPSLPEQRRIAAILDHAHTLRAKRRQVLTHLDSLTQSIFNDMFSGGGFEFVALKEAIKWSSGKFLPAKEQNPGPHPVYGGNGVNGSHDDYMFEEPRLVVGRVGAYCGAVHVTKPFSWVTDNALIATLLRDDLTLDYLLPALSLANLNQYAGVSGQPSISAGKIGDVPLPVPPVDLQRTFADRVARVRMQADLTRTAALADSDLFASLQSRAFQGAL